MATATESTSSPASTTPAPGGSNGSGDDDDGGGAVIVDVVDRPAAADGAGTSASAVPTIVRKPWYRDASARRLICMATLTLVFAVGEIIAGVLVGSLAVLADAFHMVSDLIALVVGYVALRVSGRTNTKSMSYGWSRAEVIGGLINGVFLLSVTVFIVLEAVTRFIEIPEIKDPVIMIIVGGAGLAVNVIGLIMFAGHAHVGHSHGHPHGHSHGGHKGHAEEGAAAPDGEKEAPKRKVTNLNLHGLFLHVLGDALGSVIAIIVGICIKFIRPNWKFYLDPILSLVISVVILNTSVPLVRSCVKILMQGVPDNVDLEQLLGELQKVEGACNVHDLHVWQLTMKSHVGTVHIACRKDTDFMSLAGRVKRILHKHNIHATTIQPEFISQPSEPSPAVTPIPPECMLACDYSKKGTEKCSLLLRKPDSDDH